MKKYEQSFSDYENTLKCTNICTTDVPEEKEKGVGKTFEE